MSDVKPTGFRGSPIGETPRSAEADRTSGSAFVEAFSRALDRYKAAGITPPAAGHALQGQAPPSGAPPQHLPMPGQIIKAGGDADELQERALRIRSYRQELLAANIANADTPNYKAVDIDVEAALLAGYTRVEDIPILYRTPSQPSVDGNTVELDMERAEFAQNAVMYQFTLNKVGHEYKEMLDLFRDLK